MSKTNIDKMVGVFNKNSKEAIEKIVSFIKEIQNDFINSQTNNQEISEEEKIKLIKRRMKIFSESMKNKTDYFKTLLTA